MSNAKRLSRREFLKDAALASVAVAGAGALAAAPAVAAPIPTKWDKEADVVVVGYGGAGAAAAIAAADAGAKVILIEKAPQGEEGGNSRVSGNVWFTPSPADKAITYMKAMSAGFTIPDDMLQAWAEEMGKNNDWVKCLGGNPVKSESSSSEFKELPGSESGLTYTNGAGIGGAQLWKVLSPAVDSRKIEVLYATPAKELIQNIETKAILGVVAESGGKSLTIKAQKGVILTCGGFENNPQMMRDYLAVAQITPFGTPHNTGDGIKMALRVGADLWHMSAQSGMQYGFKIPGMDTAIVLNSAIATTAGSVDPGAEWIYVDGSANRFVDELVRAKHGYVNLNSVWRPFPMPMPAYMIFTNRVAQAGPLQLGFPATWPWLKGVKWSKDNSEEVTKGWILKADTLADLAAKIKLDAKTLQATVDKWNASCANGVDAEFGRGKASLGSIKTGPFYALPLTPCLLNTQGGPKRNPKAQILDVDGKPIPRLYSAGELGSMYSFLYQGGGNVGECLAFGRIAAKNAAAEKPWDAA